MKLKILIVIEKEIMICLFLGLIFNVFLMFCLVKLRFIIDVYVWVFLYRVFIFIEFVFKICNNLLFLVKVDFNSEFYEVRILC